MMYMYTFVKECQIYGSYWLILVVLQDPENILITCQNVKKINNQILLLYTHFYLLNKTHYINTFSIFCSLLLLWNAG